MNKETKGCRILAPVSLPSSGPGLVRIASHIFRKDVNLYALHLTKTDEITVSEDGQKTSKPISDKILKPMLKAARDNNVEVTPLTFTTSNVAEDISNISENNGINMILMGWHKPVMDESVFSGTVRDVLNSARCDVCVYLERQFNSYKNILVPFNEGIHDKAALQLAHKIAVNIDAMVTVLHIVKPRSHEDGPHSTTAYQRIEDFPDQHVKIHVIESSEPLETVLKIAKQNFDLIVVGLSETWGLDSSLLSNRHERLIFECPASILVVRKYSQK